MESSKSPGENQAAPSKKKLMQARLPFKALSDGLLSPPTPASSSRKRKLSASNAELTTKVRKVCNKSDLVEATVIISDDDDVADLETVQVENIPNPYVNLVDIALKRKFQKSKSKIDTAKEIQVTYSPEKILASSSDLKERETTEKENTHTSPSNNSKSILTPKQTENQGSNNNSEDSPLNSEHDYSLSDPSLLKNTAGSSLDESVNESTSTKLLNTSITPDTAKREICNRKIQQDKVEKAKQKLDKENHRKKEREEREAKKLERKKKEEQRKQEREEKEKQKEIEKKQREEREEQKRKEREEKEEQKRKEREEKEEQKRKEREGKEEQKRKEREEKEEQKRKEREAKEEERRKKQEAQELEKQEQELKMKKTKEAFANFFVLKQKAEKDQTTIGAIGNNMLSSFALKSDMRLAPTTRTDFPKERAENLDKLLEVQLDGKENLYLNHLKKGAYKPRYSGKTWPLTDKNDDKDIIFIEDEPLDGACEVMTVEPQFSERLRPKLLSFNENRRPPYWGTYRKKSEVIKPRKPFGQDLKLIDYEVDSDDEWEEEQEGESIDGSANGSDDEQGLDEYEVDNEVFVPHGYLSDEEATNDDGDALMSLSPESQKARLKHLEVEFKSEMMKSNKEITPRLFGIIWQDSTGNKPEDVDISVWNHFQKYSMIIDHNVLLQPSNAPEDPEQKKARKKKEATPKSMPQPQPEVQCS